MESKSFDCIEMKRRAALEVYEIIKDLTPEEELRYWKEREKVLYKQWGIKREIVPQDDPGA
jgi:hypothetical protein